MKIKDKTPPIVCIFTSFCLNVLYFPAMEVYMFNYADFECKLSYVWWIFLLFILFLVAVVVLISLKFNSQFHRLFCKVIFSLQICVYFQTLFLNNKLHELTGDQYIVSVSYQVFNLLIWMFLFSGILAFLHFIEKKYNCLKVQFIIAIFSLSFSLIQSAGIISLALSTDHKGTIKESYFSSVGEYELSSSSNVIYFVIDTCDGTYVEKLLKNEPTIFSDLDGFIYYPDCVSRYSRTYPSVVYMLTGQDCTFNIPTDEYIKNAFVNSQIISDIKAGNTDYRLFTSTFVSNEEGALIDNYKTIDNYGLNCFYPVNLIKAMLHLSGYRGAPYLLKPIFSYTAESFNNGVMRRPTDYASQFDDWSFFCNLKENRLTINNSYSSAFRFYHMYGTHPGCYINAEVELSETPTAPVEALKGCIKIIKTYIEYMKDIGVYDSSTIIITADHGKSYFDDYFHIQEPTTILTLVKPPYSSSQFSVSSAQVSHEDLFATIKAGLGIKYSSDEKAIWEISNYERERLYYQTLNADEAGGEVAAREYRICGDSRNICNWQASGKYYDIIYSDNLVGNYSLSEYLYTKQGKISSN